MISALHMFKPPTTIAGEGEQTLAIHSRKDDIDDLGHPPDSPKPQNL
jgi:hypothetical protein